MINLVIDPKDQNQTIDSKLNINRNILSCEFIKADSRKCESSVQTCCLDSKICLSRSIVLHIKFHTFLCRKIIHYISYSTKVHNYKTQLIKLFNLTITRRKMELKIINHYNKIYHQ